MADQPSSCDFDELYRRDFVRLCRFIFVLDATWEEACDVAQDAYTKLLEEFDSVESPESWVRTVARNRLADLRRKRRVQNNALGRASMYQSSTVQPIYLAEEAERVLKLLQNLPIRQRDVMAWTLDGYRPKEIGRLIGISANTVSANLRLARKRLADLAADDEGKGDE